MWASYSDHVECVKILLKYGADPNKAASVQLILLLHRFT